MEKEEKTGFSPFFHRLLGGVDGRHNGGGVSV